ncbi:MAG: proton-conducting transporter membrane subunit, partial [Candidatus Phosphoribacter sp.]
MTVVDIGLGLVLALAGVTVIAALVVGDQRRSAVAGTLSATLGLTAAVTGLAALAGTTGTLALGIGLPGQPALLLAPDRLGGLFLAIVGCVSALAAWFGVGYARGASATRVSWTAYPVFVLGMVLVPASADALGFLLGWELMAISSTVLLAADHATGPRVRSAVLWYAAMTHLSFVLLLAGFAVLATHSGSLSFIAMAAAPPTGATAAVAFVLLVGGFATKAGLVPVHVWLPRAHPEAPSHVSAVMSAAMVKMGVYGLLLLVTRLLPEGPAWWGIGLLALGAPSALYGILQASVTSDLKRLLAYSTTENVGLIVTAIAVAMLLGGDEQRAVADVALVAALLLTVSHSAFKTVLFLSAGAIVHGTGERDLDRLGGLSRTMPVTSAALGVGGLAAAALPISSGFVAEWVLLQS